MTAWKILLAVDHEKEAEGQVAEILRDATPKHSESHPPSHPKDNMKGKVRKTSLTFTGEDETNAPLVKPFRIRRRSVFGHSSVLEKLASTTGLDVSALLTEDSKQGSDR